MSTKETPSKVNVELSPEIKSILFRSNGDASKLNDKQRDEYYQWFCDRIGLESGTMPLVWVKDDKTGRMVLYCGRNGAAQLNRIYNVSHENKGREMQGTVYLVYTRASIPNGRYEDSVGAVNLKGWKGPLEADMLSNAMMKADTKSKRRGTLDLLGLGMLDEEEMGDENSVEETLKKLAELKDQPPGVYVTELPAVPKTTGEVKVEPTPPPTPAPQPEPAPAPQSPPAADPAPARGKFAPEPMEQEIIKIREVFECAGVPEEFVISLFKKSSLCSQDVKRFEDMLPGLIEKMASDKWKVNILKKHKEHLEQQDKAKKPDPAIDQEPFERKYAKGNPYALTSDFKWRDVVIHFGPGENKTIMQLDKSMFTWYYEKWPCTGYKGEISDKDYRLDAALVKAAQSGK